MRWITSEKEFEDIFKDARTCVYIDSGRNETELQRLQFDSADLCTDSFGFLLKTLMDWSHLEKLYFTILDPDPYYYFHRLYNIYPCFEIEKADFPDRYLEALNKQYGNQLSDKLGIVRWEFVFTE